MNDIPRLSKWQLLYRTYEGSVWQSENATLRSDKILAVKMESPDIQILQLIADKIIYPNILKFMISAYSYYYYMLTAPTLSRELGGKNSRRQTLFLDSLFSPLLSIAATLFLSSTTTNPLPLVLTAYALYLCPEDLKRCAIFSSSGILTGNEEMPEQKP